VNYKTHLCVGGPKDGELVAIVDSPHMIVHDPEAGRVMYDVMKFVGDIERFEVLVLHGMTGDDVMRQLIANYRPERVDA
jgi:hypothetical protein